jgi:hypothetical protein
MRPRTSGGMEELRWEEFDEEGVRNMVGLVFWLFLGAGVRDDFRLALWLWWCVEVMMYPWR